MDAKERNGSEEKSFKAAVITVSDKGAGESVWMKAALQQKRCWRRQAMR